MIWFHVTCRLYIRVWNTYGWKCARKVLSPQSLQLTTYTGQLCTHPFKLGGPNIECDTYSHSHCPYVKPIRFGKAPCICSMHFQTKIAAGIMWTQGLFKFCLLYILLEMNFGMGNACTINTTGEAWQTINRRGGWMTVSVKTKDSGRVEILSQCNLIG